MKKAISKIVVVSILVSLTNCKKSNDAAFTPVFPAENKILFHAKANTNPEQFQLFTMDIDGSNEVQLTNFTNGDIDVNTGDASWSPGGAKISFITNKDDRNDGGEIYTMNADGTNITRLTNNMRVDHNPSISFSGDKILFHAQESSFPLRYQLFTMNIDGSNERQLTNISNGTNGVFTGDASWSSDGSKVVFIINKHDAVNGGEIYTMNADGTNIVRLTNNTVFEQHPSFAHSGNKILFEVMVNTNPTQYQLFTMDIDGSNETQLTNFSNGTNNVYTGNASWSPDDSKIVFVTNKDNASNGEEIYTMNADGTNIVRLTNNARTDQNPKWK